VRILLVLTHLTRGGAEVLTVEVAKRLRARGHAVGLVSLLRPSWFRAELETAGVPVTSLDAARGRWSPGVLWGLRQAIRAFRPDVVHTHTLPANFAGRLVRSFVHVPALVTSAHNTNEGGPARMAFYRLTDRLSDVTTNCSEAAVASFVAKGAAPPGRIRLLPNGVDTVRFSPDPSARARTRAQLGLGDRFVWIAVGRLIAQKDLPNLLDAAREALTGDDLLLLVGGGDLAEALPGWVAARGLGDRVRILGVREDIAELLRAADAYVMSSAWEGLPIVLLEAASTGLPIVATRVGGNADVVVDGVTGALVPPGNAAALAAAMRETQALSARDRAERGARGRQRVVEGYGIDAVTDHWLALYREVLAAGEGVPA
jgi:glycosyltransferase involved in cell wall biosynthesis